MGTPGKAKSLKIILFTCGTKDKSHVRMLKDWIYLSVMELILFDARNKPKKLLQE